MLIFNILLIFVEVANGTVTIEFIMILIYTVASLKYD